LFKGTKVDEYERQEAIGSGKENAKKAEEEQRQRFQIPQGQSGSGRRVELMTTATATPPKQKVPAKEPATSQWFRKTLAGIDALVHFRNYLDVPPPGTALKQFFAVRKALCPNDEPFNVKTLLGFGTKDGKIETQTVIAPSLLANQVAREMASHKDSDERKRYMKDLLSGFLTEIDAAILARIQRGERHPHIVAVRDFEPRAVMTLDMSYLGADAVFAIGRASGLPEGHSLEMEWTFQHPWDGRRDATYVLGPADHAVFGDTPRHFYRTESVKWWTVKAEAARLMKQRRDATTADKIFELMQQGDDPRQRKVTPAVSLPTSEEALKGVSIPSTWAERVKTALEAGRQPGRIFGHVDDPAVSLEELVTVRQALGLRDHEKSDIKFAPERFAGQVAGEQRHEDLRNVLLQIVSAVDLRLSKSIELAIEWAAVQCEEEANQ
jgi:hypothetical protein